MKPRPPKYTRTATLFPYTTVFRTRRRPEEGRGLEGRGRRHSRRVREDAGHGSGLGARGAEEGAGRDEGRGRAPGQGAGSQAVAADRGGRGAHRQRKDGRAGQPGRDGERGGRSGHREADRREGRRTGKRASSGQRDGRQGMLLKGQTKGREWGGER